MGWDYRGTASVSRQQGEARARVAGDSGWLCIIQCTPAEPDSKKAGRHQGCDWVSG